MDIKMIDLLTLFLSSPIFLLFFGGLTIVVGTIYSIGFWQGRDVSFWPPKIGKLTLPEIKTTLPSLVLTDKSFFESIIGDYFEEIPGSPDRRYSISSFKPDSNISGLTFDGANYSTDGRVFCTWRSRLVSSNIEKRQIEYIFDAYIQDDLTNTNSGFGVIYLSPDISGNLLPDSGYYIEAKMDGKPYTHSMKKLGDIANFLGISIGSHSKEIYHRRIVTEYEKYRANKNSSPELR